MSWQFLFQTTNIVFILRRAGLLENIAGYWFACKYHFDWILDEGHRFKLPIYLAQKLS